MSKNVIFVLNSNLSWCLILIKNKFAKVKSSSFFDPSVIIIDNYPFEINDLEFSLSKKHPFCWKRKSQEQYSQENTRNYSWIAFWREENEWMTIWQRLSGQFERCHSSWPVMINGQVCVGELSSLKFKQRKNWEKHCQKEDLIQFNWTAN